MDNDQTNPDQEDTSLENEPEPLPGPDPSVKDYIDKIEPVQAQRKKKRIVAVTLAIVLTIVAIFGSVLIIKNAPKENVAIDESSNNQVESTKPTITSETLNHQSSQFFLDINYPSDWEVADKRGSGQMTITSPQMNLPGPGGSIVSGQVILAIRQQTAELTEFDEGNAQAVIDSQKIKYERPSQSQRGETYLSFLNFADTASSSGIDGVYITGDFGYKKDQAIPKVDVQKIDPIVSVAFVSCDGTCSVPTPITESAWLDMDFGRQIQKMLMSLHVN